MQNIFSIAVRAALALFLLAMSGCLEVETTTQVNPDGTLIRTEVLSGDTASVMHARFIAAVDSTWSVATEYTQKGEVSRKAVKTFGSVQDLNQALQGIPDSTLQIQGTFERKFYWFFTEFRYREKYLKYNPFDRIPLAEYISRDELDQFYHQGLEKHFSSRGDSLASVGTGKRFDEWRARNIFAAYFEEFLKGVQALNDPQFPASVVESHKEELYQKGNRWLQAGGMDTLLGVFQQVLKTPSVRQAAQANIVGFTVFRRRLAFVEEMMSLPYRTSIVLPGLITDTNAPTIEGNRSSWKEIMAFAYIGDFDIWATSRIVNWWAVAIGGALVLASVVLFVVSTIRRRANTPGGQP
jgi:hypothetical protein